MLLQTMPLYAITCNGIQPGRACSYLGALYANPDITLGLLRRWPIPKIDDRAPSSGSIQRMEQIIGPILC